MYVAMDIPAHYRFGAFATTILATGQHLFPMINHSLYAYPLVVQFSGPGNPDPDTRSRYCNSPLFLCLSIDIKHTDLGYSDPLCYCVDIKHGIFRSRYMIALLCLSIDIKQCGVCLL